MALGRRQIRHQDGGHLFRRAGMLVCLWLLTLVTLLQVAHVHPATANAAANTDQCPICVAMHSAAPVDVAAPTLIVTSGAAPVFMQVANLVVRPWQYTLFNRPPPSSL